MRKSILSLPIAALLLTACAHGVQPTPTPKPKLIPPASQTKDCGELPQPASGKTQDLLSNHVDVTKMYHKCRDQLRALAEWMETTND